MKNNIKVLTWSLSFMIVILLSGCGSSSHKNNLSSEKNSTMIEDRVEENSTEVTVTKIKGYLIDSPIEGVNYICADGSDGLTDNNGMFECEKAPVTFKIGALTLGLLNSFTLDKKVYLHDLIKGVDRGTYVNSKLKLLARVVQSLDDDGNIEEKITITQSVRDLFFIEQNLSEMLEYDIESLVQRVGKDFVPECKAIKHLGDKNVDCDEVGEYRIYDEDEAPVATPTPTPDTTNPIVTLNGDATISLFVNQAYVEQNATATDDRDGNVSASIVISGSVDRATVGTYTLTYIAKDGAGNEGNATRVVNVVLPPDTTAPVVTLNGSDTITLYVNQVYVEQNATAMDDRDGNVSSSLVINGNVDTSRLGVYYVSYEAHDSAGNVGDYVRTVTVVSNLRKTGQTISYDEDGDEVDDDLARDDGYYQKGINRSFIRDDENEIVIDNLTGLMWQDDSTVLSISKQWLIDDNYESCNEDSSSSICFDTTGDTATIYCSELVMGGYEDWRLPTIEELEQLPNYGVIDPAMDSIFQNVASSDYWSSSTYIGEKDYAWIVGFSYGEILKSAKDYAAYIRCVRER